MIWQDVKVVFPALPVWPLPHEIADHLFDIQKVLHCRKILLSFPCGRRPLCWLIGPNVDWKNVQDGLLKSRARLGGDIY